MRCATLASALRHRGVSCAFLGESLDLGALQYLESMGLPVVARTQLGESSQGTFPRKLAWLVVDDYSADSEQESAFRAYANRIMVIDDVPDREHDCDILLNQNAGVSVRSYEALVPATCELMVGTRYCLIRPEFEAVGASRLQFDDPPSRLLVSLGGGAVAPQTADVLEALAPTLSTMHVVTVLLAEGVDARPRVERLASSMPNVRLCGLVSNMADAMRAADLMVGAGGTSLWERCAAALPSVTVTLADNQLTSTEAAGRAGATLLGGDTRSIDSEKLQRALGDLVSDTATRMRVANCARALVDGKGAGRVTAAMLSLKAGRYSLRPVGADDAEMLRNWRNADAVRFNMKTTDLISSRDHSAWLAERLEDPCSRLLVFEDEVPRGFVNVRRITSDLAEWGFYLGPEHQGWGLGPKLGWLCMHYCFDEMGCSGLRAEVLANNARSLSLHHALGFEQSECDGERVGLFLSHERWRRVEERLFVDLGLDD